MSDDDDMIEITIWNDKGEIVTHEVSKAQKVSPEEVKEMISLIDGGMSAEMASRLVVGSRVKKPE